jgi:electron transfer flavoprotein beta subunit
MRIAVCFKAVPETSLQLAVPPGHLEPPARILAPVMNPYDEFALEAALQLREKMDTGEILLLTVAPGLVEEVLFHGLAMGADSGGVLEFKGGSTPRPLQAAQALAGQVRAWGAEAVFCGERAVDDDFAQTGAILAEQLGWPVICGASTVTLMERAIRAECRRGLGYETAQAPLPCVVTFVRGPNLPRYPSLDGIFEAGLKPVIRQPATQEADLQAPLRTALWAPSEARTGEIIPGATGAEGVATLLDRIQHKTHIL